MRNLCRWMQQQFANIHQAVFQFRIYFQSLQLLVLECPDREIVAVFFNHTQESLRGFGVSEKTRRGMMLSPWQERGFLWAYDLKGNILGNKCTFVSLSGEKMSSYRTHVLAPDRTIQSCSKNAGTSLKEYAYEHGREKTIEALILAFIGHEIRHERQFVDLTLRKALMEHTPSGVVQRLKSPVARRHYRSFSYARFVRQRYGAEHRRLPDELARFFFRAEVDAFVTQTYLLDSWLTSSGGMASRIQALGRIIQK